MTKVPAGRLSLVCDCAGLADEIAAMVEAAFKLQFGSGAGEARLIADLRADGDVAVELAALLDREVVGYAMFSRLRSEPANRTIAALAPVAAKIGRQKSGIGSVLIAEGHRRLRAVGYQAVAVLGDPDYYRRFGYSLELGRKLKSAYTGEHFQAVELEPQALDGGPWCLSYPPAFG
ncbi:MAG: N-acetyltransferase [Proteobacteria bacterium]|nr:N-acetyltransferase [Pseudomonadota bacterium]